MRRQAWLGSVGGQEWRRHEYKVLLSLLTHKVIVPKQFYREDGSGIEVKETRELQDFPGIMKI